MIDFEMRSSGLTAQARAVLHLRDGGVRAAVTFHRGDLLIFSQSTCWTDAVERTAVAEQLARITQQDRELIAADLLEMETVLSRSEMTSTAAEVEGPPAETTWPESPGAHAYDGLAGRIVSTIDPFTEADPVAVLMNLIVAYGNCVGGQPYFMVGATRHDLNLFAALVGDTAKARKGDSWSPIRQLFRRADIQWASDRISSGLSTGEGLIWQVRDPIEKLEPIKDKGRIVDHQMVIVDPGVSDKRLLIIEPELARCLQAMSRSGNTLSAVIRDAWDRGNLNLLTKTNAAKATEAHISIIGHITQEELRRELHDVEVANGFANRIIWTVVRRSKFLPDPQPFGGGEVDRLVQDLSAAIQWGRGVGEMRRDADASDMWSQVYRELSESRAGMAGAIVARAEAQTMRLAAIYALLNHSEVIRPSHLHSALQLWAYAESSATYIWSDRLGDPIADTIERALRANGRLSRSEISNLFGRHASSSAIDAALALLLTSRRVRTHTEPTGGRSIEYWELAA